MLKHNQKELWELFEILPNALKEVIFSEKTAEKISDICKKYEIKEEKKIVIAKLIGNSLMGLLSPDKLKDSLNQEINIESLKIEEISSEINKFILYPVKEELSSLYKVDISPSGEIIEPKKNKERKIVKEYPQNKFKKDSYREIIEE